MVSQTDYLGKVIMIDCWYTGCTGCAIYYRHFKDNIEPYFRDSQNFKVISINLDPNKKIWLKSIYENRYTDVEHINLFAAAKEYIHSDFLDHYGISGAPFTLLIDKNGKILLWALGGFGETDTKLRKIITGALNN
jgi:hypothetical protein